MGRNCDADQYWDPLVKECLYCSNFCQQPNVITRCTRYCVAANCKALPGHYYDLLLKKCVRCAEVCGKHPAECIQHCKTPTPPVTTQKLLVEVTPHVLNSRELSVPTPLEDSAILLYSLLALCMVLLFSCLSLALAVFLREHKKKKNSIPGPKESNHNQGCVVQPGQEVGRPGGQSEMSYKDFVTNTSRPTYREPSDDSIPTETCVCVHCFPDLKTLGQGNDRTPRAPFSLYPQAVLHRAQIQKGRPLWTEETLHTSGLEVQQEASVG